MYNHYGYGEHGLPFFGPGRVRCLPANTRPGFFLSIRGPLLAFEELAQRLGDEGRQRGPAFGSERL